MGAAASGDDSDGRRLGACLPRSLLTQVVGVRFTGEVNPDGSWAIAIVYEGVNFGWSNLYEGNAWEYGALSLASSDQGKIVLAGSSFSYNKALNGGVGFPEEGINAVTVIHATKYDNCENWGCYGF